MESYYGKVVLVTGATSGIGKAVAERLARLGCRVYGTSRGVDGGRAVLSGADPASPTSSEASEKDPAGFLRLIRLDVCDNSSVEEAIRVVSEKEGRIDVLVNNAGFGMSGAIEETSAEEALSQFNTNFFGMHRMCRGVLPTMRSRGRGLIINIGSVAGLFAIPYQAMYSASKYAVEAYTEALRMEVREFGIHAVVVEPGDTRTGFTDHRYFCRESRDSLYQRSGRSIEKMMRDERNGAGPERIAEIVEKLLTKSNPPVRITVGPMYKTFVFLKRLFPARLVEQLLRKMYC